MKAWIYVEGASDARALEALCTACGWVDSLRAAGWGIQFVPLDDKSRFLKRIGPRSAEKLCAADRDIVIALPDLYPMSSYDSTQYCHKSIGDLRQCQLHLVTCALREIYGVHQPEGMLRRFFPSAFKYDLEMLLLLAEPQLRSFLHAKHRLSGWRQPVEDQNDQRPPKRVIEELFRNHLDRRSYRDTVHAPAILRQVKKIRPLLHGNACPEFKRTIDWIVSQVGVNPE